MSTDRRTEFYNGMITAALEYTGFGLYPTDDGRIEVTSPLYDAHCHNKQDKPIESSEYQQTFESMVRELL